MDAKQEYRNSEPAIEPPEDQIIKDKELSETIINSLPGIFYLYNNEGKFLRWNENLEIVSGYSAEEITQMIPTDFFPEDEREYIRGRVEKAFADGVCTAEANLLSKNGRKIPHYFTGRSIFYNGQLSIIGTGIDITAKNRAEELLKASEEKYRQLFYENPYPMLIFDIDNFNLLEVNNAALKKYGYSRNEFLNLNLKNIQINEILTEKIRLSNKLSEETGLFHHQWKHRKKSGEIITAEVTFLPTEYSGKKAMQAQINDITEKIQLEEELLRQQRMKQRQITQAVIQAQEKVRSEIGKELHDNINQILSTVKLYIEAAMDDEEMREELLSKSAIYLTTAIQEIRVFSKDLGPPSLKDIGLRQSIEELIENIHMTKSLDIKFHADSVQEELLPDNFKLTIYRIIQEQLNNILKYAAATAVEIVLHRSNKNLYLLIADNGRGFDPSTRRRGVGITHIISRAEVFNGKVEIDSAPSKGCRLSIVFNMEEQFVY